MTGILLAERIGDDAQVRVIGAGRGLELKLCRREARMEPSAELIRRRGRWFGLAQSRSSRALTSTKVTRRTV
jgi:hypothetical protein